MEKVIWPGRFPDQPENLRFVLRGRGVLTLRKVALAIGIARTIGIEI